MNGNSTKDSILYTTFSCCIYCAKELINAGVKEIVYKEHGIEKVEDI